MSEKIFLVLKTLVVKKKGFGTAAGYSDKFVLRMNAISSTDKTNNLTTDPEAICVHCECPTLN